MKAKIIVALIALIAVAAVTFGVCALLRAEPGPVHAVLTVQDTVDKSWPTCLPSAQQCVWQLWRVQRQVTGTPSTYDVYVRYRGQLYHAHAALHGKVGSQWLYEIIGHYVVVKGLAWWAQSAPEVKIRATATLGDLPEATCRAVANKVLVGIDGAPPPCPDGGGCVAPATVACGASLYLRMSKVLNGQTGEDTDAAVSTADGGAPAGNAVGPPQGVDPNVWSSPDAGAYKTCYPVPVSTPCP